jgi:hypothetical protein
MPESHQDKGPEEGFPSLDRQDMAESPLVSERPTRLPEQTWRS